MTDSITLLREQIGMNVCNLTSRQCAEIADEIERLKADLNRKPEILRQEIDKRVAAETERCAVVAEDFEYDNQCLIAAAIRGTDND